LHKLREQVGAGILIRVDANQGYDLAATQRLAAAAATLNVEFIEQPMPAKAVDAMRRLPPALAAGMAVDESLHDEEDALALAQAPPPFGIYNIKLMKCGGITSALGIAGIAEAARIRLMWGCMDESVISIAAALHAAYACPATQYLDLDGSFDLSRDLASGGFVLQDGYLSVCKAPGLGVRLDG
jgi:L-alanine-DL-glutamate epimerase-like enolase superfamily enzyme